MLIVGSITGKEYNVVWSGSGWSYAAPFIKIKRWWWFDKLIELPHETHGYLTVDEFTPKQMKDWFQDAVDRKERHDAEWAN